MRIWPASKFAVQEFKQPAWLVPGIIPGYGILMMYAHPKVGKSIMSIQLLHAIGTQSAFLGSTPERKISTLYYTSDLPANEWAFQIKKLGVSPQSGLHFAEGWHTIHDEPGLLYDPKRIEELKTIIMEHKFDFVVYDSLLSLTDGKGDLDKEETIRRAFKWLQYMSGKGNPLEIIHHKRKGSPQAPDHTSTSAAGSYALSAGVSVLMDLKDVKLEARGRFLRLEMKLKRGREGIWLPSSEDLYDKP